MWREAFEDLRVKQKNLPVFGARRVLKDTSWGKKPELETYIKREHLLYDRHQISSRFFFMSLHRRFFSVLQIQTDYSKEIR